MKTNKVFKKILVSCIVIAFVSLTMTPLINARIISLSILGETDSKNMGNKEIYKLLIIAPIEFENYLRPLVKHKYEVGVSTKLVTLQEVYEQIFWQGRDEQEKIKYFIKKAIEEWSIKYVLLVGGRKGQSSSWYFPVRYSYLNDFCREERYISDLYYADIYDEDGNFSSWDSNGNGVYGEWTGESAEDRNIDLYPDVYLGRLPCRNRLEVRVMVNKIIHYEKNTYGKPWFNKIVVVAGDTFPDNEVFEGEANSQLILENMSDFEPIKLWTSDGTFTGLKDVIKTINKGCGFIYLAGHGTPAVWGTLAPPKVDNNDKRWVLGLRIEYMPFLFNGYKLPICVIEGCANSQFDVTLRNILDNPSGSLNPSNATWIPECLSWQLTRKIGGGSIVTIGCTGEGSAYGHYADEVNESWKGGVNYLNLQFFVECGVNNAGTPGEAWGNAIRKYLDNFPINWDTPAGNISSIDTKTVQSWVIFGDPTLKIGGYSS